MVCVFACTETEQSFVKLSSMKHSSLGGLDDSSTVTVSGLCGVMFLLLFLSVSKPVLASAKLLQNGLNAKLCVI